MSDSLVVPEIIVKKKKKKAKVAPPIDLDVIELDEPHVLDVDANS